MSRRPPLSTTGTVATAAQPLLPGLGDLAPASVAIVANAYRVDWGTGVRPRFHTVSKSKTCRCGLGPACPSVLRVREYLDTGGVRAPDVPDDVWPAVPEQCPICGTSCRAHPRLDFTAHGLGWTCLAGGTLHYWEARLRPILRAQLAANGQPRWVIPPEFGPGDDVLYPGVTIEDVRLARERAWETHRRWQTEGYSPSD
ncbi:MAG: hypothetical protein IT318_16620 [Anaerolineales bacterium]|nr:hypothetical protein [Anaerolineales bacterium]